MNKYVKKVAEILSNQRTYNRVKRIYRVAMAASTIACVTIVPAFAADPLAAITNLSNLIFTFIKIVGVIVAALGFVNFLASLQSHDASQRTQGIIGTAAGVLMACIKEILDKIIGG